MKIMKKIILGTIAGIATGYFLRKIQEKANLKEMYNEFNNMGHKTKRKMKGAINKGLIKADGIKDQIENKTIN